MRRLIACLLLGSLATTLAGCVEEEVEPQTPVAVRAREFSYGRTAPADQPSTVYVIERPETKQPISEGGIYPMEGYATPPPRQTVSLGFIGDEPVGRFDNGGGHDGPWWRPFPARWMHDSWTTYRSGCGRYGCRRW